MFDCEAPCEYSMHGVCTVRPYIDYQHECSTFRAITDDDIEGYHADEYRDEYDNYGDHYE